MVLSLKFKYRGYHTDGTLHMVLSFRFKFRGYHTDGTLHTFVVMIHINQFRVHTVQSTVQVYTKPVFKYRCTFNLCTGVYKTSFQYMVTKIQCSKLFSENPNQINVYLKSKPNPCDRKSKPNPCE